MPGKTGAVSVSALFRQFGGEDCQQHSRQRGSRKRDGTGQETEHGRIPRSAPVLLHRTGRESIRLTLRINLHAENWRRCCLSLWRNLPDHGAKVAEKQLGRAELLCPEGAFDAAESHLLDA